MDLYADHVTDVAPKLKTLGIKYLVGPEKLHKTYHSYLCVKKA